MPGMNVPSVARMRVLFVCAAPRGSRTGNRRTAERWARLVRELGHGARIVAEIGEHAADVVVALHARHSAAQVVRARERMPHVPIVLALTGTDLSHDIRVDAAAQRSLVLADRLVVLHELAPLEVPARHRDKVVVIRQSAPRPRERIAKSRTAFEVAVVGHLRDVKDPLRCAIAARRLPASSRIRVIHAGGALDRELASAARAETRTNPRYRWIGDVPPSRALRLIARARLLVLSSKSEGGANVLGEAIMCGTPVVATDIPAARAALGSDYPALFRVGDDAELARLLARAESDARWLADLARRVRARRPLFGEARERAAWRALLTSLSRGGPFGPISPCTRSSPSGARTSRGPRRSPSAARRGSSSG
jgi:putative glycosyltransferase (TIGR04348 family)